jgi:hypothetical protein
MGENNIVRYFTLEEANSALAVIRPLVAQIREIRQNILEKQPEAWQALEKAVGNGGSKAASEMQREFQRLETLVKEVQSTGAIVKDVNEGLIDFLALRDGMEIYLCWKYNEEQINFWHDIDAGFAGRQSI